MSTKFVPIQIPPGVVAQATKNMRSSNWSEVNLMRWIEGELQPIGGHAQYTYPANYPFASRCKAIHSWYDLTGQIYTAYVCQQHVYVDKAGVLTDITPAGGWPVPPLPGQGGYGDLNYSDDVYGTPRASGLVNPIDRMPNVWSVDNFGALLLVMYSQDARLLQWDPGHPTNVNDVQTLSLIGVPTGGTFALTFNGQTTAAIAWNATAATVQAALVALSNIGSGNVVCAGGPLPTPVTITFQASLGNSAQALIQVTANNLTGGTAPAPSVAHTTVGSGALMTPVSGAPHGRCFVVTQERFVQIFGQYQDGTTDGGSSRRFGWCDQENLNAWNFGNVVSQAGFLDIEPASPIVTAIAGRFGTLFFTAKKAYISRYIGLPYVYDYKELADDCTPWSPASITTTSSQVMWMSQQGMFAFDGSSITAVACLVRPWITDDIDLINVREQACAAHVGSFSEFWWFFPQAGQPYNTRCIIHNYKEGWWSMGQMSRSAGITSSYTSEPIFADGTVAFRHEYGVVYGNATPPWAETFDLNLTSGARLVTLKQVIPDIKGDMANVAFSFHSRRSRSIGDTGQWTPPVPIRSDGYVDARTTGRGLRIKLSCVGPHITPFTVGQHLVDFVVRGDR